MTDVPVLKNPFAHDLGTDLPNSERPDIAGGVGAAEVKAPLLGPPLEYSRPAAVEID